MRAEKTTVVPQPIWMAASMLRTTSPIGVSSVVMATVASESHCTWLMLPCLVHTISHPAPPETTHNTPAAAAPLASTATNPPQEARLRLNCIQKPELHGRWRSRKLIKILNLKLLFVNWSFFDSHKFAMFLGYQSYDFDIIAHAGAPLGVEWLCRIL